MSKPPLAPSDTDAAYATALASLGVSPGRLRKVLADRSPAGAWQALAEGRHPVDPEGALRSRATPAVLRDAFASRGSSPVAVRVLGLPGYPESLAADIDPPAVLFALGDLTAWEGRPRVAIVGTRSATAPGRALATELGAALADAGVVVVSGLARGIDSAVHSGVVHSSRAAPPVAVLGTAVDAKVTAAQAALRRQVGTIGVLLSELPPGAIGARWWFAVRNRVMAALAHVVVVVECHTRGGALHTVAAARRRGVCVAAVPGSIRSAASAGTNALLVQGAQAVRDADDVLALVASVATQCPEITGPTGRVPSRPRAAGPARQMPSGDAARTVRRALDHDPASLDVLVRRSGLAIGEVALALERLADAGIAVGEHGWWSLSPR
jgi:DNA processing protein